MNTTILTRFIQGSWSGGDGWGQSSPSPGSSDSIFTSTCGEYGIISTLGSSVIGRRGESLAAVSLAWLEEVSASWDMPGSCSRDSVSSSCLRLITLTSSTTSGTGLPVLATTGLLSDGAGVLMEDLHIGQFCLIFNQGSTHFLWNSCLKSNRLWH